MTDESWTIRAREGHYRAVDAASYDHSMDYAINGLMPATGATIWFGAGSTGKTQLLLWMAAHMAAVGNTVPDQWLGADICVRGNILVLTAEDLREHLLQRISAISRQMVKELGGTHEDAAAICGRIHVMAFLSMTDIEFPEPNACLFERGPGGRWQPSPVLKGVKAFSRTGTLASRRKADRMIGSSASSSILPYPWRASNWRIRKRRRTSSSI